MRNLSYVASLVRAAFGDDKEKGLKELLPELRCSRKTAFYWLKSLERQGFLSSFHLPSGRGRPRLHYRMAEKLLTFEASPLRSPDEGGTERRTKESGSLTARPITATTKAAPYAISVKDRPISNNTDGVAISFQKLQRVCRLRKGGMCKALLPKTLQRCERRLCPIISVRF